MIKLETLMTQGSIAIEQHMSDQSKCHLNRSQQKVSSKGSGHTHKIPSRFLENDVDGTKAAAGLRKKKKCEEGEEKKRDQANYPTTIELPPRLLRHYRSTINSKKKRTT